MSVLCFSASESSDMCLAGQRFAAQLCPMFGRHHAAETEMVCAGVDLALSPCAHHVAGAVLIGAQKGTAPLNFLWLVRLFRIQRRIGPLRISCYSTSAGQLGVVIGLIPVTGPLPNVAGHVVEPVSIWGKLRYWSDAGISVLTFVFRGKDALMSVGHPLAVGPKLVAPNKRFSGEAAAGRKLPLGLSGEPLSSPLRVCLRILVGDMNDGIVVFAIDVTLRTERMPPVRSSRIAPPLEVIVEWNRMIRG